MTRLNDHQLAQQLEHGEIVIIDESAGTEIVVDPDTLDRLSIALGYFRGIKLVCRRCCGYGLLVSDVGQRPCPDCSLTTGGDE